MTYHPESGNNIKFKINSYNPPTANDLSLASQEKYYIVPNAEEIVFELEKYTLLNTDLELIVRTEDGDSSDESPNYYKIPASDLVNFNLELYTDKTTNLDLSYSDTETVTHYYEIPLGSEVNFNLESYINKNTNLDLTPEKSAEEITNELEVIIKSKSNIDLYLRTTMGSFQTIGSTNFESKLKIGLKQFETASSNSKVEIPVLFKNELYIPISSYSEGNIHLTSGIATKFKSNSEFVSKIDSTIDINYSSNSKGSIYIIKGFNLGTANSNTKFNIHLTLNSVDEIIMILSSDFDLVAYLESYNDLVWHRKWRNIDDFELTINYEMENAKYLQLGNYIARKKGDVVHAGRINSRNLTNDKDTQTLEVSGKGLGEIFENRIAYHDTQTGDGYDTFSGSAESAMKHYIENNVVNPEDTSRMVSNLKLEKDRNKGTVINYKARFQKLSEILYEISKTTGLGWDVQLDLDNKDLIFKVLSAKIKKGVRLSPNFESVNMINFKEDKSESENTITIAGQGQGSERMIRTVNRNEV